MKCAKCHVFRLSTKKYIFFFCLKERPTLTALKQTWKKTFFVNSETLGLRFSRKKTREYDKFEIKTIQRKSNI